jgi:hypothetical protein
MILEHAEPGNPWMFGRRLRYGRKPYSPKNQADALSELTRFSMKLTRWREAMDLIDSTGKFKTALENFM